MAVAAPMKRLSHGSHPGRCVNAAMQTLEDLRSSVARAKVTLVGLRHDDRACASVVARLSARHR